MTLSEELAYLLKLKSIIEKSWLNKYMRIKVVHYNAIPMANVSEHYVGQTYIKIDKHGKEQLSNYHIHPAVYSGYSEYNVAEFLKRIAMKSPILVDEITEVM